MFYSKNLTKTDTSGDKKMLIDPSEILPSGKTINDIASMWVWESGSVDALAVTYGGGSSKFILYNISSTFNGTYYLRFRIIWNNA